jgi:hypothetical protein
MVMHPVERGKDRALTFSCDTSAPQGTWKAAQKSVTSDSDEKSSSIANDFPGFGLIRMDVS